MKCIIICMTCMFAVALTVGGPIRRQTSQSEKTFPIGGNVTLMCPLPPDDTWIWVYWKKNDHTIYSLEVKSNTPWTNDPRYEGSNDATRLTIKDLQKTDSGIYHCKVATLVFIKERGHVLLSVTDQEVGLSTTSPGVSFRPSTTIPPQPAVDNTIDLVFLIFIPIIFIFTMITAWLVFKNRELRRTLSRFGQKVNLPAEIVSAHRRPAPRSTSTPLAPDCSHHEIRDEEGTHTNLLSSDTHGRDDVDVDDMPEESSNAYQSLAPRSTSTPLDADSSHHGIRDEAHKSTPTPVTPDPAHHEIRDMEGTHTHLLGSDTHGRCVVNVHDRPEESSNASQSLAPRSTSTPLDADSSHHGIRDEEICKTDDVTI